MNRSTNVIVSGVYQVMRRTLVAAGVILLSSFSFLHAENGAKGPRRADLSNLVIAGDSLSAGYQNSQLTHDGQSHGYASVIAAQAGLDLKVPYLTADFPSLGYGPTGPFPFPYAAVPPFALRTSPADQTHLVAVPGYTLQSFAYYPAPCAPAPYVSDGEQPGVIAYLSYLILNPNCTNGQRSQPAAKIAGSLQPSTAIVWIGSNDALFPMLFSGSATDPAMFKAMYVDALSQIPAGRLVLATIPDVTLLPYLISPEDFAAEVGPIAGPQHGDMLTPYAYSVIGQGSHYLPPAIPDGAGGTVPVIMSGAALKDIRDAVHAYNKVIRDYAASVNATVVDIHGLVKDIAEHGIMVNGQRLTTDYMGGLFSKDGIHPTNTGYAVIANEFIKTMNREMAAGIPPVSIADVAKTDPMVPARGAGKKGHVSVESADALRSLTAH